jgi:hypothetical protein
MLGVHGKPYGNFAGYNDRGRSRADIEKERIRLGITKPIAKKLLKIAKKQEVENIPEIRKEIKNIGIVPEPHYLEFMHLIYVITIECERQEVEEVLMLFNFME